MLGIINQCAEAFIRENFGDDAWLAVVHKAELTDTAYISTCPYADADTYGIVIAASQLVGVSIATALELFGEFFVGYIAREGHGPLLKSLGQNIWEMLANLNNLHLHLQLVFRAMDAPSFRCQEITATSLQLHYYSKRPLLGPLVKGVVQASAKYCFNHEVTVTLLHGKELDGWDHDVFRVEYPHQASIASSLRPAENHKFTFTAEEFSRLYPFHLLIDTQARVVQVGSVFSRVVPGLAAPLAPVAQHLKVAHPHGVAFDYQAILPEVATTFVIRDPKTSTDFKGMMIPTQLPAENGGGPGILFLGAPRVDSLASLERGRMFLSDLPGHDMGRDYVLLAEQQLVDSGLRERSERLALEMKELAKNLAEEKELLAQATVALQKEREMSDTLLHQLLPTKVAATLRSGEKVAAKDYPSTTVLFSDIVGFSTISRTCTPRMVCEMLDELYLRFDAVMELPEFKPCYKVETIGDAYMVCCGVTEPCEDHAERVLRLATQLVEVARLVHVNDQPLTIRVGIHSGHVVAGVVGKRMPRFCLFGDTVNTASRMESHGVPGAVHLSARTFSLIRNRHQFNIEPRGDIEVKGLGTMTTYVCRGCTPAAAARNSNPGKIAALAEVVHVNRRGSAGILVPPGGESDAPSELVSASRSNSIGSASHVSVAPIISRSAPGSTVSTAPGSSSSASGAPGSSMGSAADAPAAAGEDDPLQTFALSEGSKSGRRARPKADRSGSKLVKLMGAIGLGKDGS